jgi:hypothetical protein
LFDLTVATGFGLGGFAALATFTIGFGSGRLTGFSSAFGTCVAAVTGFTGAGVTAGSAAVVGTLVAGTVAAALGLVGL